MKKITIKNKLFVVVTTCIMLSLLASFSMAELSTDLDASPARIALNGNGELLVTDYAYGQVLTVAPDTLDIINTIDINGRPLGIAYANEFIYVGNSTTGQVEVYNSYGQEQFVLGFGNYPIHKPQDMAIGNGNVYVVDGTEEVVKVFDQDGTFINTIPGTGYDQKILANPTAIAVDEINQQIYVSDYGDLGTIPGIEPRIQVFDFTGSLVYTINSGSSSKFRFTMPQGLYINGTHQLYVIDSLTGEIHIFNALNGNLLSKVKGSGIPEGQSASKMPLDLVIDNTTQNVFVTNNMMASIKVFPGAGEI